MQMHNIAYAGLDIPTWFLLIREPSFSVKATAYIPRLADQPTPNPINVLWKRLYSNYYNASASKTQLYGIVLILMYPFLTGPWRKYNSLFRSLLQQRATLLDFKDLAQTADFLRNNVDL